MKHQHNQRVHLTHPKFLTTTWLLTTLTVLNLLWTSLAWAFEIPPAWLDRLQEGGTARVIVVLNVPVQPEGTLNDADAIVAQRADIAQAQQLFLDSLQPQGSAETRLETIPALVMVVDTQILTQLQENPFVASLQLDAADETMAGQTLADQLKELERVYESSHSYAEVTAVKVSPASAQAGDVRELMVANFQSVGITVARGEESASRRQVRAANPTSVALCGGVTAGLVACYPFDGNALDGSGNGNHGTVNGATLTTDRFGKPNSAYLFDGSNSYIQVADTQELRLSDTDFTLSAWVSETARNPSYQDAIMVKTGWGSQNGWFFSILGSSGSYGTGYSFYNVSGGGDPYTKSASQVPLNTWHHHLLTYEKSQQQVKMYIDGVLNSKVSGIPAPNKNTANDLFIGKASVDVYNGFYFHGMMDDLRIYNRAVSETEIKQLYGKETLTVTKTGYGNVTGQGINCGTVCGAEYANGSKITLTAVPVTGATFTGWSGDCTGTGTTVDVTMDKAKSCVATFSATLKNPANGHTYQLINWGMTWQNGESYCASQGGYLATITSQGEQDFVFNNLCAGNSFCLLGGWQEKSPRRWHWSTNEPWTYSHWKPNNGSGDNTRVGMYGVMGSATSAYPSFWNDIKPTDTGVPICEWNPPMMTLTVTKTGNGKVTGQGVNCGTDCAENYAKDSSVTLTAVPVTGATFNGWSGDCTGTGTTANVTMDKAKSCVATFSATITNPANGHTYQLVNQAMTWSQGKDYCASQGGYLATITSVSEQNFVFNNLCAGNAICSLGGTNDGQIGKWRWITNEPWGYTHWNRSMPNSFGNEMVLEMYGKDVLPNRASFWNGSYLPARGAFPICEWDAPKVTLTVTKTGTGQGQVASSDTTLNCGTTCKADYAQNSTVTLTATPTTGNTFTQWSGACSGTAATTTVTLDQAKTCTATFDKVIPKYTLTVFNTGTGTGSITGTGITCGTDCTEDYNAKTLVTLTATPATGSQFVSWGGACSGTATTATVTMTQAQSCTANFAPANATSFTLTVAKAGTGQGTIRAQVTLPVKQTVSLICKETCATGSYDYPLNNEVSLTAAPATGFTFTGWSCNGNYRQTGTPTLIKVTMDAAKTCTATFQ